MTGLLVAVAASSLAGSVHCAAMCGPLLGLYQGPGGAGVRAHLAHAGGRGLAYVLLGTLAGTFGSVVNLAGELVAVQRAAWILGATAVIFAGGIGVAAALGVRLPTSGGRTFRQGLVQLRRRKPVARAAMVGVLSAALPCGWLWAFVALAASAGSTLGGAAVMAVFWLGTLPMMLGIATVAAPLLRRVRGRMPLVSSMLLVGLGAFALIARAPLSAPPTASAAASSSTTVPHQPTCHGHH